MQSARTDFDLDAALARVAAEPAGTPAVLLREAERLFAERGFEGVRMRDVARAAGVNISTLHFHWRDKATLYYAVGTRYGNAVLGFVAELARDAGRGEPRIGELLDRWIDWSVDFLVAHPLLARMYLRRMLDGAPLPGMDGADRAIADMRFARAAFERRLAGQVALSGEQALIFMFTVVYSAVMTFIDSDVQQALLGGSVYRSAELRERLKDFARTWYRRMLMPGGDERRATEERS
jgi:AcrR family transcriptional regulator